MNVLLTYDLHQNGNYGAVNAALEKLGYKRFSAGGTRLPNTTWWNTIPHVDLQRESQLMLAHLRSIGGMPERVLMVQFDASGLSP